MKTTRTLRAAGAAALVQSPVSTTARWGGERGTTCGYRCANGFDLGLDPEWWSHVDADPECPDHSKGDPMKNDNMHDAGDRPMRLNPDAVDDLHVHADAVMQESPRDPSAVELALAVRRHVLRGTPQAPEDRVAELMADMGEWEAPEVDETRGITQGGINQTCGAVRDWRGQLDDMLTADPGTITVPADLRTALKAVGRDDLIEYIGGLSAPGPTLDAGALRELAGEINTFVGPLGLDDSVAWVRTLLDIATQVEHSSR